MHTLFVYGTLKRGFGNHKHYLSSARFLGEAIVQGKLYSSGIPYMTYGNEAIHGELYRVDDDTLKRLDQLEGHPSWYVREPVAAVLKSNEKSIPAEAYFMPIVPEGAKHVKSGRYETK